MADILTRRAARQQAKQNRGYNRGQFQTAMVNSKNALRRNSDLRGKELRQTARRMVAGVGEYAQSNLPGTFEEFINQPKYIGAPDQGGGGESSSKPASGNLNLTGKTDNWNISDILSEDFYNDLQNSIQAGIDEEIANQENAGIQNIIDHRYDDLGPTMNRPDYMIYMPAPTNGSKPGWYASGVTTWRRGFRDGVYGDITSKDGKDYFNPLPEEYQNIYRYAKVYQTPEGYSYTLVPDMDHYYGGIPMPIGRTIGYRPANPAITGSTPKQITGGGALVPTW